MERRNTVYRWVRKSMGLFFICICLFSTSCNQNVPSKTQSTTGNMCRLFLDHLMIREGGLYTLLGSKPMTSFDVSKGFPEDLPSQRKEYEVVTQLLSQDKKNVKQLSFEEYVAKKKTEGHHDFRKLWEVWKIHYQKELGEKYIIIDSPDSNEKWEKGLFINIPNTIYVLKKYQDIFEKETEITYNAEQVLNEVHDKNSLFWSKVFSNSYLFGILMGYGERNSLIWTWCHQNDKIATIRLGFHGHPKTEEITKVYFKKHLTVSDLLLPVYASFSVYDETLESYQNERETIIRFFHGKDFERTVLGLLRTRTSKEGLKATIIY